MLKTGSGYILVIRGRMMGLGPGENKRGTETGMMAVCFQQTSLSPFSVHFLVRSHGGLDTERARENI